jgi:hypothetical protein
MLLAATRFPPFDLEVPCQNAALRASMPFNGMLFDQPYPPDSTANPDLQDV